MGNGDVESICFRVCVQRENPNGCKDCDRARFDCNKGLANRMDDALCETLPNKVALHRKDNDELLGLMSYELDEDGLAVEILYLENARHSNANLLHSEGGSKKYVGIAKALFAYAIQISLDVGFDGVLIFKAKTSELLSYYIEKFGARQVASYDPYRLVIWEDAAEDILSTFTMEVRDNGSERA